MARAPAKNMRRGPFVRRRRAVVLLRQTPTIAMARARVSIEEPLCAAPTLVEPRPARRRAEVIPIANRPPSVR